MKQSRRQELKTNELSVYLQQLYASAVKNANYLIGGLLAAVLILVIAIYVRNQRQQSRAEAWDRYFTLQGVPATQKADETLKQVRDFAQEQKGDSDLGGRASNLIGEKLWEQAMFLDPVKDAQKRTDLFKQARDQYKKTIEQHGDQPVVVAHARISLASILESLYLSGNATKDEIRSQYQQLVQTGGLYHQQAAERLADLDERLQPLKLVDTRPAEEPATRPATTTTRPATPPATTTTRPATTAPAARPVTPGVTPATTPVR